MTYSLIGTNSAGNPELIKSINGQLTVTSSK